MSRRRVGDGPHYAVRAVDLVLLENRLKNPLIIRGRPVILGTEIRKIFNIPPASYSRVIRNKAYDNVCYGYSVRRPDQVKLMHDRTFGDSVQNVPGLHRRLLLLTREGLERLDRNLPCKLDPDLKAKVLLDYYTLHEQGVAALPERILPETDLPAPVEEAREEPVSKLVTECLAAPQSAAEETLPTEPTILYEPTCDIPEVPRDEIIPGILVDAGGSVEDAPPPRKQRRRKANDEPTTAPPRTTAVPPVDTPRPATPPFATPSVVPPIESRPWRDLLLGLLKAEESLHQLQQLHDLPDQLRQISDLVQTQQYQMQSLTQEYAASRRAREMAVRRDLSVLERLVDLELRSGHPEPRDGFYYSPAPDTTPTPDRIRSHVGAWARYFYGTRVTPEREQMLLQYLCLQYDGLYNTQFTFLAAVTADHRSAVDFLAAEKGESGLQQLLQLAHSRFVIPVRPKHHAPPQRHAV